MLGDLLGRLLSRLRLPSGALLTGMLVACTSVPPKPSTLAERTPTPGSVTRDNPAGDAESPVDAALIRLIEERIGVKDDKFRTLRPRFADARNWKRVRFFTHPTRAAFRYGDDGYAAAVILYREAEDDTPRACLDAAVAHAQRLAEAFDVEVGPFRREVREFPRGIEAVDQDELARATEIELARQIELYEARKRRISRARAARRLRRNVAPAQRTEEQQKKRAQAAAKRDEARRKRDARRERVRKDRAHRVARKRLLREAGVASIPVLLTSGHFATVINSDRYLAAIVAYPSWPGTCLVQGFAVQIGSDEVLAEEVLERWISEQAPQLKWRRELTEQPPIQNR